ncbi:hypothetical protein R1flu_011328 [Riccia fluitans]|uniref:Secreted protein n=1 Tax=Riccia fluitans TaxID=41844 RepID=A0ABD1Z7V4_9MARC
MFSWLRFPVSQWYSLTTSHLVACALAGGWITEDCEERAACGNMSVAKVGFNKYGAVRRKNEFSSITLQFRRSMACGVVSRAVGPRTTRMCVLF